MGWASYLEDIREKRDTLARGIAETSAILQQLEADPRPHSSLAGQINRLRDLQSQFELYLIEINAILEYATDPDFQVASELRGVSVRLRKQGSMIRELRSQIAVRHEKHGEAIAALHRRLESLQRVARADAEMDESLAEEDLVALRAEVGRLQRKLQNEQDAHARTEMRARRAEEELFVSSVAKDSDADGHADHKPGLRDRRLRR